MNFAGSGFFATADSAAFLASSSSSLTASAYSLASFLASSPVFGAFFTGTVDSLSFLIISLTLSYAAFSPATFSSYEPPAISDPFPFL